LELPQAHGDERHDKYCKKSQFVLRGAMLTTLLAGNLTEKADWENQQALVAESCCRFSSSVS
jgi:hypothetical protein